MWEQFMAELRETHLGIPSPHPGPTVAEQLRTAYEAVCARPSQAS